MIGQAPIVDALVHGVWQGPCDGIDWYVEDVHHRVELLLALPAPPGANSRFMYQDDYALRSGCVRRQLADAAARWGVPVYDLADAFCPDGPDRACSRTARDGIHVEPQFAEPALSALVDGVRALTTPSRRPLGADRP
jgi:hypothetical protein